MQQNEFFTLLKNKFHELVWIYLFTAGPAVLAIDARGTYQLALFLIGLFVCLTIALIISLVGKSNRENKTK